MTVFADPLSVTIPDPDHSVGEALPPDSVSRHATKCSWLRTWKRATRFESSVPARRRAGNAMPTKKKPRAARVREPDAQRDTMRPEYDFSKGVRGKYAARFPHGSIVITLDPDVAAAYPSAAAANEALRSLIRATTKPPRGRRRSA